MKDSAHAALRGGSSRPSIAVDLRALVGEPTGIGYYTQSLLCHLAARRQACFTGMAHRPIADPCVLEESGVRLQHHGGPLGVWWQQVIAPQRLAQGDFDLFWSPITTLPLRLPVPGLVTIHDLTALLYPEAHRLKVRWSVLPFLSSTVRRARRIAVDSVATAEDVRRRFPHAAERVEVVYPGVDSVFRPLANDRILAFREAIGCPDGYLLYAGTLEPRKNLHVLLTAWEQLRRSRATTPPLLLAGPYGWRSSDLLRRIETLGELGLRYLGRVSRDRLVRLMQSATFFVYPSRYEGFGLPPAEAMACGVPVIASDRSSLPEVVGEAGLLVDPDRPFDLAAAMQRLIDDPALAGELGDRGRQRVQRFAWSTAAETMEGLFFEALA